MTHEEEAPQVLLHTNMVDYPFPLREGHLIGHLILPRDLTVAEVKRLAAFMMTLVME